MCNYDSLLKSPIPRDDVTLRNSQILPLKLNLSFAEITEPGSNSGRPLSILIFLLYAHYIIELINIMHLYNLNFDFNFIRNPLDDVLSP